MDKRTWNRSLFVASLIAASISAISVWFEWNTTQHSTVRISLIALTLVLSAAGLSYTLRIIRFYMILSQSGVRVSLPNTALAQAVGFALSVTPGSLGEVFKLHVIQERSGTTFLQAAPALVLDRAMEGAGFVALVLVSAVAFPALQSRIPGMPVYAIGLALLLGSILLWRRAGGVMTKAGALWRRFLTGRRLLTSLHAKVIAVRPIVTRGELVAGFALTGLARIADGLVLLLAAQMLGVSIALPAAIFVIALGGFAGGISLLPGGAGAVESTMAALLMFWGVPFAAAIGITLLARISTLWLWVALGLGTALIMQFKGTNPAKQPLRIR